MDKHFKGLKDKYINYYGERYNCSVPNYKRLYKVFTSECDKYGILYDMKDIIKAYKREIKDNEQISFRRYGSEETITVSKEDFITLVKNEINNKK